MAYDVARIRGLIPSLGDGRTHFDPQAGMQVPDAVSRTVSTFSVWKTTRQMVEMVHGRSKVEAPARHADAMQERERRDFHHEFATYRFRPLSEHGSWLGRSDIVPR